MRTAITDRVAGALGTVIVLALIGLALLAGLGIDPQRPPARSTGLVLIQTPPPPQPRRILPAHAARRTGRASPPNLKNKATPTEAPRPILAPPPLPTIVVAPKPAVALAANSGAASRSGPGEGAGGRGDGPGSGGAGEDNGGGDTPPRQIRGELDFADMPRALRDAGVGGTVVVRYRVERDGRAADCRIDASTGNAELDARTCALIERRFRFVPALDETGRPFGSTIVQRHIWTNEIGERRNGLPAPR